MTKRGKESSTHPTLFDWLKEAEAASHNTSAPAAGSLDVRAEFKAAVSEDIRRAQDATGRLLSRAEVAARMTDLTGHEITLSMLNNWTAPSHEHHMPAEFLPAFVLATARRRAFEVLSRHSGLFALPGPEALRAEIQRIDEEITRKQSEKLKRLVFLGEMESGR